MSPREFFERLFHNWPAKVLSVLAAIILFLFFRISTLEERSFSVPLDLTTAEGFIATGTYPRNVRLILRGEGAEIFNIDEDDINVAVDFSSHRNEGEYRDTVRVFKAGYALQVDPLEIRVEPPEITIALERKIRKQVEVFPTTVNSPEKGFELGQFFVNPRSVVVEGPRSVVGDLNSVTTAPIDLAGLTEDLETVVALQSPGPFTLFPETSTVQFRATVVELQIVRTYDDVEIISLFLDPALTLPDVLPLGSVRVQGTQAVMESVGLDDIYLVVDASSVEEPGTYRLSVDVEAPRELIVLGYEPAEVDLIVEPGSVP